MTDTKMKVLLSLLSSIQIIILLGVNYFLTSVLLNYLPDNINSMLDFDYWFIILFFIISFIWFYLWED